MKRGILIGLGIAVLIGLGLAALPMAAWRLLVWILWDPEGDD